MTLIDFKCEQCGHTWEHLFRNHTDIVNTVPCEQCNQPARRLWNQTNFIHSTRSSMYGKWEPCFAEVVRDYGHKQELLKKYGVIESSDRVGGSNCYRDLAPETPAAAALADQVEWDIPPDLAQE